MNHNSNDWALCREYRQRTEANAEKMRLAQSIQSDETNSKSRRFRVTAFQDLFIDHDPKLTRVPLSHAYLY